jgi:L-threonylcarbamoyladenylate synthase
MMQITRDIETAAEELKKGNVIALPSETVYGLAADALNPGAVVKIYEIKERPKFNPLIVHIHDMYEAEKYAVEKPELAQKVFDKFAPGPVTIVFKKQSIVPDITTAGLDTVALRIPAHKDFRRILKTAQVAAAAPSANRSGKISPTTAEEVLKELEGKVEFIFDGGKCEIGIESTVIAIEDDEIKILRPGYVTKEDLQSITPKVSFASEGEIVSPGLLKFHYEPETPLYIGDEQVFSAVNGNTGFLDPSKYYDLKSFAINLYSDLRRLDEGGYDYILTSKVKDEGLGIAINDRLEKAARGYASIENGELKITAK